MLDINIPSSDETEEDAETIKQAIEETCYMSGIRHPITICPCGVEQGDSSHEVLLGRKRLES